MVKFNRLAVSSAAAVLCGVLILGGCSGKDSTETTAETESTADESESDSSGEDATAQMTADEEKISALDPKKPEDLGKVNKLEYKGLKFEAPKEQTVTDEDADNYIKDSILAVSPVERNDGVVETGDTVNINYTGKIDGEEFEGGSADSYDLKIGSGSFIDGFEDGLIGKHYGETVELDLTFPEDYGNEELAGKAVVFTVDINSIKRNISLDELTDEDAKTISGGEVDNVADFKATIKKNLTQNAMLTAKSSLYNNAIAAALEKSDVEPKDETVEWQMDSALKSYDKNLQTQGWNLAYYLYMMGTNYDDFRESIQDNAREAAKEVMLRYAVCDAEGLKFNEDTKKQYIDEFGYTEEQFDQYADEAEQQEAVIWYLAGKTIADNADVTFVEETEAETESADAAETADGIVSEETEETAEEETK